MQRDPGSTSEIIERDRKHFIHPYQVFDTYLVDDVLPIERGAGAQLVDTEGRSYIDAVGGMWCTNIGLGRDEMADAIARAGARTRLREPVHRHDQRARWAAVREARLAGPGRSQPRVLVHRRLDRDRRGLPDDPVLPICPWQARQAARDQPRRRLSRHDVCVGVDRRQARRPGAGFQLHRRHDPPLVVTQPLPLRRRPYRAGVRRRPRRRVPGQDRRARCRPCRGVLRRADHGIGWRDHAAGRLSPADVAGLPRARHRLRQRRGRHRVRPAR